MEKERNKRDEEENLHEKETWWERKVLGKREKKSGWVEEREKDFLWFVLIGWEYFKYLILSGMK